MTVPHVPEALTAHTRRVERLREQLAKQNLDSVLVTNPENRRYLSGFTGHDSGADSAGALIVSAHDIVLITDGRYTEQAANECPDLRIVKREGEFAPVAARLLIELGARRTGFEAAHVTFALYEDLRTALAQQAGEQAPVELVATRRFVEPLRAVKDGEELAAIERAVAITDETFLHLTGYLRPGLTERQVAHEIERYMVERGAEGMAFDPHVASGPNAALPHAIPGDRVLALGEPITIDMGARYAGYCSDMTRTVFLGEPGPQWEAIYDLVLKSQETCEAGVRPGMNGKQADALARDVLEAAGHGEHYLHSTGHGLGLEIHEDPRLSRFAEDSVLEPGMVITIEPGVYLAGSGGVRIEDTAVVTEDGIRVLTHSHKGSVLPR
ncbi:MAG: M24 family metallopeptidase [Ktedonobacterales bacterium]